MFVLQEDSLPHVVCDAVTGCRQTEAIGANIKGMVTNDREENEEETIPCL